LHARSLVWVAGCRVVVKIYAKCDEILLAPV